MTNTLKLLTLIILFFCSNALFAQSHNTGPSSDCKYARPRCINSDGCVVCPACAKERDEEQKAKRAEDDKRREAAAAKYKADEAARIAAFEKSQADARERSRHIPKLTLSYDAPKVKAQPAAAPKPIEKKGTKNIFLTWDGKDAVTGQQIVQFPEEHPYKAYPGHGAGATMVTEASAQYAFPPNILIHQRDPHMSTHRDYFPYDIIDINNKTTFNDNSIESIRHLYGNWFIICYKNLNTRRYSEIKFYNFKTKVFIDIPLEGAWPYIQLESLTGGSIVNSSSQEIDVTGNEYYFTGQFSETCCLGTIYKIKPIERNNYVDKLIDELTGGPKMWKAAIGRSSLISGSNVYEYKIYYIDINDHIKSIVVPSTYDWYKATHY